MSANAAGQFSDDELLALLRDDSVPCETIAAEMEDAGASPHPVAHLTAIRGVLRNLSADQAAAVEALPETLRDLVIGAAAKDVSGERSDAALALISALASSKDKSLSKAGKKVLHGLKSRGMKVVAPVVAPIAASPAVAAAVDSGASTLMSSVDGAGRRIVLISSAVRGGFDVAQLFLSDETGVLSADMLPLGRKEYRKFLDKLFKLEDMIVVETPRPYVRGLIARALDLNARAGRAVPPGFNDTAFLLGPACEPQASLGRSLSRSPDESSLAARGAELLALREFRTWLPPESIGNALDTKLTQIEGSKLFVDETQRNAAMREAARTSADEFWRSPSRAQFAERLFEMAFVLNKAGRIEHSALSAAIAWSFEDSATTETNSFAVALFDKFVTPEKSAASAPADPASLLITG